jgi:hypothetical protein
MALFVTAFGIDEAGDKELSTQKAFVFPGGDYGSDYSRKNHGIKHPRVSALMQLRFTPFIFRVTRK